MGGDTNKGGEELKHLPIDPAKYEVILQGLASYFVQFSRSEEKAKNFVEELLQASELAGASKFIVAQKTGSKPHELSGYVIAQIPVEMLSLISVGVAIVGMLLQSEPTLAVVTEYVESERQKQDPRRN